MKEREANSKQLLTVNNLSHFAKNSLPKVTGPQGTKCDALSH